MNAITSLRVSQNMVYQKRRYLELITKCLYFLLYHPWVYKNHVLTIFHCIQLWAWTCYLLLMIPTTPSMKTFRDERSILDDRPQWHDVMARRGPPGTLLEPLGRSQPSHELCPCLGNPLGILGMAFCPIELMLQVLQVAWDWYVMSPRLQTIMYVVLSGCHVMEEQSRHGEFIDCAWPCRASSASDINMIPVFRKVC